MSRISMNTGPDPLPHSMNYSLWRSSGTSDLILTSQMTLTIIPQKYNTGIPIKLLVYVERELCHQWMKH